MRFRGVRQGSFVPVAGKASLAGALVLIVSMGALSGAFGSTQPSAEPAASHLGLASAHDATMPTTIYDGPGRPFEPSVAINAQDPQHIVGTSMDQRTDDAGIRTIWMYTHVSRDGGATWNSAEFPGGMSAGPTHPLFAYDEIFDAVIKVLPDGTVLLVAMAARQDYRGDGVTEVQYTTAGNLFVARSFDGGETWPDIRILRHGVAAVIYARLLGDDALSAGGGAFASFNDKCWFAVGADGTILLTWVDLRFPSEHPTLYSMDIWYATSTDLGETWSEPSRLVAGQNYPMLPAVLRDGGLRVAYRNFDMEGRWEMVSSDNGGATWTTRVIVPASELGARGMSTLLGSTLVVEPLADHDRLFLPFAAGTSDVPVQQLKFTLSDDGGDTWTTPVSVDDPVDYAHAGTFAVPIPFPSAAAADGSGTTYVTYHHMPVGSDEVTYKVVRVRDGIASEPEVLDDDLPGSPLGRGHYTGLDTFAGGGAYATWVTSGSWSFPGPTSLVGRMVPGQA